MTYLFRNNQPQWLFSQRNKIIKIVDVLIHGHDEHAWNQLNLLIYELYGISKDEAKAIDSLYDTQSKQKDSKKRRN